MKISKSFFIVWAILFLSLPAISCTTAIISGKYTADGRPVLWKHRDTDHLNNRLVYFQDGAYPYIGLVNSDDAQGTMVWAGTNSAGFAIMNAALYDVNLDDTTNIEGREGYVMKQALQQCATLADFEQMLRELNKPMGLASSFGVIDAHGGAAYYEVDNQNFVKYDVNDSRLAPHGYLIRTNFSYRGRKDQGYGYIRHQNAIDLFDMADATGKLNVETILQEFSRSTYHSLLDRDYEQVALQSNRDPHFIHAGDMIIRHSSASAVVIHGVKEGESPQYTTMWTLLGYPMTSVATPVWVGGGRSLPEVLTGNDQGKAPLCEKALELKKRVYPIGRGSGPDYMNITALYNSSQTGITQQLKPVENQILKATRKKLSLWRKEGMDRQKIRKYYQWLDNHLSMHYERLFDL